MCWASITNHFPFLLVCRRQLKVEAGVNDRPNEEVVYLDLDKRLIEFQRYFDQFSLLKNKTIVSSDFWKAHKNSAKCSSFSICSPMKHCFEFLFNCTVLIFKLSPPPLLCHFEKFFRGESYSLELETIALHNKKYFFFEKLRKHNSNSYNLDSPSSYKDY